MNTADRVLELLYDRVGGHFAMEELSARAGLSGAQLTGAIDELRRRGHQMELTPAHGVRLVRPVRLDAHLVERGLRTLRLGRNAICFDEVDSTNDVAFQSASQDGADGAVILAESQRCGRGRLGRSWRCPPGAGVLMSVLLIDRDGPAQAHEALTIAAGLAVAEGIADAAGLSCGLRWPNDVMLDGAKVAGILVEVRRRPGRRDVVVGIGINANASPPPSLIARPATCLAENLGHPVERTELVRAVLRRLDGWIGRLGAGGSEDLHVAWMARCGMVNQRVRVVNAGVDYVGRVLDVGPLDGLTLACDDGTRVHLPAETSTLVD